MRIIGGQARGRRLVAPRGSATRPTSDRVREALFNILGPPDDDLHVLDIFAGAGTLGLEALSRGAERCTFVDHHRDAVRAISTNLKSIGFSERASVITGDARKLVATLGRRGEQFGWVFADPPYATSLPVDILTAVDAAGVLVPGGTMVVEHDRRVELPDVVGGLGREQQRRYGDTVLSFFGTVTAPADEAETRQ